MVPNPAQILDVIEKTSLLSSHKLPISSNLAHPRIIIQVVLVQRLLQFAQLDCEHVLVFGLQVGHQDVDVQTLHATLKKVVQDQ